jgi:Mrp family chromosome partitioning ATPase
MRSATPTSVSQRGQTPRWSTSRPHLVWTNTEPSMAVHVVLNQKGGVGKSTISVNLAAVTADVLNRGDDPDASSPVLELSVDPHH